MDRGQTMGASVTDTSATAHSSWGALYREHGVIQPTPSPEVVGAIEAFREAGAQTVLDLGCGTGRHLRLLVEGGFEVHGCERSQEAVAICGRAVPGAALLQADMTALPYASRQFDAVLCYQVIQHDRMIRVWHAAREIQRVLRPGGVLFLRVPSTRHPEASTGSAVELGTRIGIDAIDGQLPHHYFAKAELKGLFRGFEIVSLVHKMHASEKDRSRPAASWSLLARRQGT